ncbi:transporter [Paraburkholderia ginsengiterrae]|uniref:Transporter n=1 Tax=Paraburkholderia ginsengiterrae TaxID=1462993 RepID=A0A1A9NIH8_9BURK|nr:AEC family transporter [Paraburkholderia ginsengiterrae]OAJ53745.1 transporter [Paraburkholderia ginsengiterrae]OAJ65888.1 transporter [Paraburkholderia ginsengiterrae]
MLDHILGPLVPVAFVIVLGFIAGKRGKLNYSDSLLISKLVLNWIFPALLPAGMAGTPRSQLLDVRFVVATFIAIMGMYALAFATGWYRYRELKAATLKGFVCGYPDGAFMGIPILQAMFGPSSLYAVLVLNLIASLVMIPLTTMLLAIASGEGGGAKACVSSISAAVRRPLMWAPAIGILCSLLAVKLPPVLNDSLNLLCALPSATIPAMFANEAGAYRSEAATSILASTVLSVITFSFAIYLIDGGLAAA